MTDATVSPTGTGGWSHGTIVALGLFAVWFVIAAWLGANGVFAAEPGRIAPALPIAVVLPGAGFLAACAVFPAVRQWALSLDPALVVGLQAWRVVGLMFVFFWMSGMLPAVFAIPAGFGDFAVGVIATFAAVAVARGTAPGLPLARLVLVAGLLDLVIAVATGTMSNPGQLLAPATGPTSQPMSQLPLSLVPTALVPWFVILHLISWMHIRAGRTS